MRHSPLLFLVAFVALLALACFPASAQTAPPAPKEVSILWLNRLALSAGANYDWHTGSALNPEPTFKKEFAGGLYGAYVLTEHLSAYGAAVYGVDNKVFRFSPGIHYRFHAGTEFFAFGLTYDYYAGTHAEVARYPHEWAGSVNYARPINKSIVVGASEAYGFDNREWRTSVGIRVPLFFGKDS